MDAKHYRLAVIVAALGYFVDIYDLLLFSIVRVPSLQAIGVPADQLLEKGVLLINTQMAGLLIGGVLWGILGDKRGRLSVLFGSILLYSAANLCNAFVDTIEAYAVLRFIAGLGLAGELGAGITLVSELMPKHSRGWGTTIVAAFGILGAVLAGLIGDLFDWRTAYIVGGVMGLALLALRLGVSESGLFEKMKNTEASTGRFFALFGNGRRAWRYLCVVCVGVPIWYLIGIIITFSPEFGKAFGMTDLPTGGKAVMFAYAGLSLGDLASGALSQWLGSRKKSLVVFMLLLAVMVGLYFEFAGTSLAAYYAFCAGAGFAAGYWAMFMTVASEQFGTNIRSTVTTTAPNFVRGAVIPMTSLFQVLKQSNGVLQSGMWVGILSLAIAFVAITGLHETFGKDLDYLEPL